MEMMIALRIAAVLMALVVFLPQGANNAGVRAATEHLLKTAVARARTEALARHRTVVLCFEQAERDAASSIEATLVVLGETPGEDCILDDALLPEGTSLSKEDFPLNIALSNPLERPDSPLDGSGAYIAFNEGGALVSLTGGAVRCNLRVLVETGSETSGIDLGINHATGIVQGVHLPAPPQPQPPSVEFAGLDSATRGNWSGKYGASGKVVCNYYSGVVVEGKPGGIYDATRAFDFSQLPDYVADYAYSYDEMYAAAASWGAFVWGDEIRHNAPGHDLESGLLRPDRARMSSSVMAPDPKGIRVTFTLRDNAEHLFSIYATENTPSGRYMTVVVEPLDDEGLSCGDSVFAQCTAEEYLGGIWFRFRVSGSFRVTLKNVCASMLKANTFVSGFFFDEPEDE